MNLMKQIRWMYNYARVWSNLFYSRDYYQQLNRFLDFWGFDQKQGLCFFPYDTLQNFVGEFALIFISSFFFLRSHIMLLTM